MLAHHLLATSALLAGLAAGQTALTVNPADGSANFQSLDDAVVAAQDGDVLLCQGAWFEDGLFIDGKGISIVGAPGSSVFIEAVFIIDVPAPKSVQLSGVTLLGQTNIRGCSGGVVLEQLLMDEDNELFNQRSGIDIRRCDSVSITDCDFRFQTFRRNVLDSVCLDVRNSTVVLQSSNIIGRHGAMGEDGPGICTDCCTSGTDGAIGIRTVSESEIRIVDCLVMGGDGGVYNGSRPCGDGLDAPALEIDPNSNVVVVASQVVSTAPSTGPITVSPDVLRTIDLPRSAPVGTTVSITVRGEPGDTAFVLVGPEQNAFPGSVEFGILQASPSNGRLRLGSIDATGLLTTDLRTPVIGPGLLESLYVQAVFVRPGGTQPRTAPARRITFLGDGLPAW